MKKKQVVTFSTHERRVFELNQTEEMDSADARALRRSIDAMPWLVTLAEFEFDDGIARALITQETLRAQGEFVVAEAIKQYRAKRKGIEK